MPLSDTTAPAKHLLLLEARIAAEWVSFHRQRRSLLRTLPRGNGQPLIFLPGFCASDDTLRGPRQLLNDLGYAAYGWRQGRNLGLRRPIREALNTQLQALNEQHGQPVTLIGWSLGGVFAREMARHQPQCVRRVITLGSPINGHPDANNLVLLFKLLSGSRSKPADLDGFARRITPPPVPCTAIYSRTDGIVAWRASREDPAPNCENLEVRGSHFGLPFNARVLQLICERLSPA